MNRTRRILIKFILFLLVIVFAICCFFKYGAYFSFSTLQREMVINAVTSSPDLPDNFVKLYVDTHPGSACSFRGTLASTIFGDDSADCPCQDAATDLAIKLASGKVYKIAQLTFFIEEYATQRQCLAFFMNNTYFAYNNKGASKAAQYYYHKNLEELNDDEMLELIAMSKNPYFYNKVNHRENLAKQVELLRKKMKNQ